MFAPAITPEMSPSERWMKVSDAYRERLREIEDTIREAKTKAAEGRSASALEALGPEGLEYLLKTAIIP